MPVGLALEGRREHAEEVASGRPTDQGQSAGLFSLAYAVFVGEKKKEKCFSKLSTFKNRESSPKKSLDFHFLIITTKANTSVSSTTCLALVYMTYIYSLLCSSGQFRGAGIFIVIPFYSWGNRGRQ